MTRIAFSGDQHIGATHLTTLAEQRAALTELASETIRRGCRALVLLGDATHTLRPSPDALRIWGEVLETLGHAGVRVVAIAGNHEGSAVTSLLSHFRGSIDAVSEPTIIADLYGVDLACLPWLPDAYVRASAAGAMTRDQVARELTRIASVMLRGFVAQKRPDRPLVLATHATIAGATTGTGFNMGYIPGGAGYLLRAEDLVGFDHVFAGHIHAETEELLWGGWPVYTGSLLPLDFSEDQPRGFIVYDSDNIEAERVEIHTPPVKTFDVVDEGPLGIESFVSHHYGLRGIPEIERHGWIGMKARVRVRCSEAHARQFPPRRIEEVLQALGVSKVQVELTVDRPERQQLSNSHKLGPLAALEAYLDRDLPEAEADAMHARGMEQVKMLEQVGEIGGGDLELLGISAQDFLGVHEADVRFSDGGIYSLTGPVGAGKSTLGVDVPRFALFGESRIGSKMADRLIRSGADEAIARVELRRADGQRYMVARKVKRTARGASATLDVLEAGTSGWRPLSTGKIADGERIVRDLLGGLDDETLCAANLVVQRGADAFTRARPEDRKRLLAQAAGLQIFDRLADLSREAAKSADRQLAVLQGRAGPLRDRVAGMDAIRKTQDGLTFELTTRITPEIAKLEDHYAVAERQLVAEQERGRAWDRLAAELAGVTRDADRVARELLDWQRRRSTATAIVGERAAVVAAREDLDKLRATIVALEAVQVAESEANDRVLAATRARFDLQRLAEERRASRQREVLVISAKVDAALEQERRLADARCPVIAEIRAGDFAACAFLEDAQRDVATLEELGQKLERLSGPTQEELDAFAAVLAVEIPAAPDQYATNLRLVGARARARALEDQLAKTDHIARAEEVVAQADDAVRRLHADRDDIVAQRGVIDAQMAKVGKPDIAGAYTTKITVGGSLEHARREEARIREQLAELAGRLASLSEDRAELELVEQEILAASHDGAAYAKLIDAWRACRVQVLETAVIPAVEDVANDVLRRFPYGLQVALATQREARSGETVETLDVEVLGGRGGLYELCSGGERTTIDTALHIAVALVVSRRASTRLRFVVIDEPEGLDEPGRFAFAAVARWLNEAHGLTVLAMSHMADLVDALGGQRLVAEQGPAGAVVRAA